MNTVLVIVLFIVGLILTVKGGDWFVDAASWLAEATGIPRFIIGATIVSFATTLPELLVSSIAGFQGQVDMAIGNAVGSVNANTGLIMALSVLFLGGLVGRSEFRNKGILFIAAAAAMMLFSRDMKLVSWELTVLFIICLLFVGDSVIKGKAAIQDERKKEEMPKKELAKNIFLFLIGAVAMAVGAKLMVDNGEKIAHLLNVPDIIISITLVAIGTSLPELVTTITAIRKKQSDISIGNIIGANVMDMCFVVPVSGLIAALKTGEHLVMDGSYPMIHVPMSVWIALVAVVPTLIFKKTAKWQGALLALSYIAYLAISLLLM